MFDPAIPPLQIRFAEILSHVSKDVYARVFATARVL